MSHNILIPFYHTCTAVMDNAQSHLRKLTEWKLNNNLSVLLIAKFYIFIIFAACGTGLVMDTTNGASVCAVDFYQITAATNVDPPVCAPCLPGSTTEGQTSSDVCSKYGKIIIPIPTYKYYILSSEI